MTLNILTLLLFLGVARYLFLGSWSVGESWFGKGLRQPLCLFLIIGYTFFSSWLIFLEPLSIIPLLILAAVAGVVLVASQFNSEFLFRLTLCLLPLLVIFLIVGKFRLAEIMADLVFTFLILGFISRLFRPQI